MNCSEKQRSFITSIITNNTSTNQSFKDIFEKNSTHDKYKFITFQQAMEEKLKPLTSIEASNIIKAYHFEDTGHGGINLKNARNSLARLKL